MKYEWYQNGFHQSNFEEINDFEACGRIVGYMKVKKLLTPQAKHFHDHGVGIEIGINGQLVSFLVRPTTACRLDDLLYLPLRPRVWSSGRASASHAEGLGSIPRSSHTKDFKNGTFSRCA